MTSWRPRLARIAHLKRGGGGPQCIPQDQVFKRNKERVSIKGFLNRGPSRCFPRGIYSVHNDFTVRFPGGGAWGGLGEALGWGHEVNLPTANIW